MSALRTEVEYLLFHEADLLDRWQLDDWLKLLTADATYFVPPNDKPDGDHNTTLFIVADDAVRLRERIIRLKDPSCHSEWPPSRTRRIIGNVKASEENGEIQVRANFILNRHRRGGDIRTFSGEYRYRLRRENGALKIAERRVVLDAEELGHMGSVSFLL